MGSAAVTFLTPYWSGREMMRIHLASIRAFHPGASIMVSKRGGGGDEMAEYRREFAIEYWLEDCGYTDAYLRLLQRCRTDLVCILDHDTVLLSALDPLLSQVSDNQCDLVGVEERIRWPNGAPGSTAPIGGWLRFAPGNVAANFLIFNWAAFRARWGLRGVFGTPDEDARHFDFDYGIGQHLRRHHYLRPYHAARYGIGNLLIADGRPIAWHQWYGAYRDRLDEQQGDLRALAAGGESRFLGDYPQLDFTAVTPAWDPDCDVAEECARARRERQLSPAAYLAPLRRAVSRDYRSAAARLAVAFESRG